MIVDIAVGKLAQSIVKLLECLLSTFFVADLEELHSNILWWCIEIIKLFRN